MEKYRQPYITPARAVVRTTAEGKTAHFQKVKKQIRIDQFPSPPFFLRSPTVAGDRAWGGFSDDGHLRQFLTGDPLLFLHIIWSMAEIMT